MTKETQTKEKKEREKNRKRIKIEKVERPNEEKRKKKQKRNQFFLNFFKVGETKFYNNFGFVRVYGGGHMTPHDQPEVSLELFRKFLNNEPF